MDEHLKATLLKQRESILGKVKEYTDDHLNPNKKEEHLNQNCTISKILEDLGITEQKYYHMLSISHDIEF